MNQVSFEEIGALTATFLAKEDVVPGQVVTTRSAVWPCPTAMALPECR